MSFDNGNRGFRKGTVKVNIQEKTSDSDPLMDVSVGVLESGPTPQNYVIVEGWGQDLASRVWTFHDLQGAVGDKQGIRNWILWLLIIGRGDDLGWGWIVDEGTAGLGGPASRCCTVHRYVSTERCKK